MTKWFRLSLMPVLFLFFLLSYFLLLCRQKKYEYLLLFFVNISDLSLYLLSALLKYMWTLDFPKLLTICLSSPDTREGILLFFERKVRRRLRYWK